MEKMTKRNGTIKAWEFKEKWVPREKAYFETFPASDGTIKIWWNHGAQGKENSRF
ncbi:MAG: hypothetical protein PUB98_00570 [Clostridiales bacterium]|nr:hypothetical protein [Clostridiales bacterium]